MKEIDNAAIAIFDKNCSWRRYTTNAHVLIQWLKALICFWRRTFVFDNDVNRFLIFESFIFCEKNNDDEYIDSFVNQKNNACWDKKESNLFRIKEKKRTNDVDEKRNEWRLKKKENKNKWFLTEINQKQKRRDERMRNLTFICSKINIDKN